jgi:hypothetical protein
MNILLWILQMMLGGMFLIHGWILLRPPTELKPEMAYIRDLPTGLRYFIGVVEILYNRVTTYSNPHCCRRVRRGNDSRCHLPYSPPRKFDNSP